MPALKLRFLLFFVLSFVLTNAQTTTFSLSSWNKLALENRAMMPMYGQPAKTLQQLKDTAITPKIIILTKPYSKLREKSDRLMAKGWTYYYAGKLDTAMFQFNKAWAADSANVAAYIGFSVIYGTLGNTTLTTDMYTRAYENDTITASDFWKIVQKDVAFFRKLEQTNFISFSDYKPFEYYPDGLLFIARKKAGLTYYSKWYHENGNLLREVKGGARRDNWKGEVQGYHSNGTLAHSGHWRHSAFVKSKWISYDTLGSVSQIEYWKKGFLSHNYKQQKTIIYSQEIPWKKECYVQISKTGWELKEGEGVIYPDGYIQEVYNFNDFLYKYYVVWKNGKAGERIKTIPPDCTISNAQGTFEWFKGKLYQIK